MSSLLRNSYTEVSCILDILGEKYKSKVPKNILDCIYKNKNDNYKFELNEDIEKISISRNALVIISILNLKYWENDENEIKRLKESYMSNEQSYRRKINEYKNSVWQKEDKKMPVHEIEEKSLMTKEDKSIWSKIKKIIKKIFQK